MTTPATPSDSYFRKGFGLGAQVKADLAADYSGHVVDLLRERDYTLEAGGLTVRLAREFGFCYGVDRAVEYAYQSRKKFPDRRTFLLGEIIHNPHVNANMRRMGIEILSPLDGVHDGEPRFDLSVVGAEDVVILPAFGVTVADFEALRAHGCVMVDTTCGSVLNVWKRVEAYARDGFTALIHGKYYHEETRATASQVLKYPGGRYLVVRDMAEAEAVCAYVEASGRGDVSAEQPRTCSRGSPRRCRPVSIPTWTCARSAWRTRRRCSRASRSRSARRWERRWPVDTVQSTGRRTTAPSTRSARRRRIDRMPSTHS
jgi:4-hydroxy-3-methylbut-2-enyl diphosphate reductase